MTSHRDPPILTLGNIHKSFGPIEVLHGIDLEVSPGEVVALLGENGAGKSTVSNIISGSILPTSGEMTWMGRQLCASKSPRGDRSRRWHDSPGTPASPASVDRREHVRRTLSDEARPGGSSRDGTAGEVRARAARSRYLASPPRRRSANCRVATDRNRQDPDTERKAADPRRTHRSAWRRRDRTAFSADSKTEIRGCRESFTFRTASRRSRESPIASSF